MHVAEPHTKPVSAPAVVRGSPDTTAGIPPNTPIRLTEFELPNAKRPGDKAVVPDGAVATPTQYPSGGSSGFCAGLEKQSKLGAATGAANAPVPSPATKFTVPPVGATSRSALPSPL